ncbi:hypothetical protein ACS0TY_021587 [Phlomoides rotata]
MLPRHVGYLLNLNVLVRDEELEGERGYQIPIKPSPEMRRDLDAFVGAAEALDMEESTDNAPPSVVADQLEAFRKEIEAMRKQIHDRVPTSYPEVKINALTNGLRDGHLFSFLANKPVATFNDLLRRDKKYITLEEVRKAKKVESKPSASEKKKAPEIKSPNHEPTRRGFRRKFEKYTPLKLQSTEVLHVIIDHPEMKFPYS